MSIDRIAQWCAPWNDLFGHSTWVSGTVTGLHIMALVIAGGLAIAADRMTLRVPPGDGAARRVQLREVRAVHGMVLTGVVLLFVTGVLLAAADVETFLPSIIFWIKLGLVALLVVNGGVLTLTERRLTASGDAIVDDRSWSRVRVLSTLSVILWIATAVAGIVLSNAA